MGGSIEFAARLITNIGLNYGSSHEGRWLIIGYVSIKGCKLSYLTILLQTNWIVKKLDQTLLICETEPSKI